MKAVGFGKQYSLKGKSAIVTGGLGLLGKRFCSGLAEFGASVAVIDLNETQARKFASELKRKYRVGAIGAGCDVASPSQVRVMVERVQDAFGEINVLHNNAATQSPNPDRYFAPFEKYSLNEWRRVMSVNLDGMFLVAQAVGNQMVKQKTGGSIIQTASIYGLMAPDQRIYEGGPTLSRRINSPGVYAASKGAVIALTKYLAAYWAPQKIRVNTLTPGGVESGQNRKFKKLYSHRVPLGRMAYPDEIVGALIYLASDASSYVTGQNLIVDGGLSAW